MSSRSAERTASVLRRRSLHGLDFLNFFLANVQTGFGPFIAVYLTAHHWTQVEIGAVLTVGTITGMASQVPAGALIDATPRKRGAAAAAIAAIMLSALLFALRPNPLPVLIAEVLHGFASAMVLPAIAAITLTLVNGRGIGERFGRNARWAAVGNAFAAAAMGAVGYTLGYRPVFLLTAAIAIPALLALALIRAAPAARPPPRRIAAAPPPVAGAPWWRLLLDRRVLAFAGCAALFQLANAAMLQLAGGELTKESGTAATAVIAACIVLPQVVVAALSPWVGRAAERWGRRPVLLAGFLALPLRALLFAATASPALMVSAQGLDGIGGAVFGVLVPLIAADLTAGTARFNLCMGTIGFAGGIGAAVSTTLAGAIADGWGVPAAFVALAAAGIAAELLVWTAMPETAPAAEPARSPGVQPPGSRCSSASMMRMAPSRSPLPSA
ncbi:MAG: MFS transporter [Alphaproteobacteria bacterium]|nr:MFS transporter [Alphaproteobacteria bacterium]